MLKYLADYIEYRRAIVALEQLSTRELDDIGITRGDMVEALRPCFRTALKRSFAADPVNDYLSSSTDLVDLERRQRTLARKGVI